MRRNKKHVCFVKNYLMVFQAHRIRQHVRYVFDSSWARYSSPLKSIKFLTTNKSVINPPDQLLQKIFIFTTDEPWSFVNFSSACIRLLYLAESLTKSPEWKEKRPVTFHGRFDEFVGFLCSKLRGFSILNLYVPRVDLTSCDTIVFDMKRHMRLLGS